MSRMFRWTASGVVFLSCLAVAETPIPGRFSIVKNTPGEPEWGQLLKKHWGLDSERDLRNPLHPGAAPAAVFQRVDTKKPVTFKPIMAFGAKDTVHGGFYPAGPEADRLPKNALKERKETWSFIRDATATAPAADNVESLPLADGSATFDPQENTFGLWISCDSLKDAGVYTQPALVAKVNPPLKGQPCKVMIYPNADPVNGRPVPDSYVIGWSCDSHDDFQDVVTRIDNVLLLAAAPALPGILPDGAKVKKLAGDFKFVEGPAWDPKTEALYFSDIPPSRIIRYAAGRTTVVNADSGESNGLMFDKAGKLIACEGGRRRISKAAPGERGEELASQYEGKKLNSPNDLWLDAAGGLYFTDPRYGRRDDLEQDKEAVYYVAADGKVTRIIDDLVRPNGIGLSPDGRYLYVVDNGADTLHRYSVMAPGKIAGGSRIAFVTGPDGMSVDAEGRLYVTCAGGVWVFDGDGKWLGMIATPEQPANCTFGGAGWGTLFITARTSLYAIETRTRGWHVHLDGPPPGKR